MAGLGLLVLGLLGNGVDLLFGQNSPASRVSNGVVTILLVLYWIALIGSTVSSVLEGRSPGKEVMGLRVVSEQSGEAPGTGAMLARELIGRVIGLLFGGLGFLWALLDRDGQGWHDKLARTVVVKPTKR